METSSLIVLLGIMLAMAAVPSGSVAIVVARTLTHGRPQGVLAAAGIVAGDVVLVVLVLSGLTAVAEALGDRFVIVRYVAAVYLVLLGLSLLRRDPRRPAFGQGRFASLGSFLVGFVMTLGDLKALFFYAALFPTLVDVPGLGWPQASLIVVLTALSVGGVKLVYVALAHRLARVTGLNAGVIPLRVAGGVSIGAGFVVLART